MEIKSAVATLAALAQDSRLSIYRTLVEIGHEGLSAGKISEVTGIAPSSLSFHLKELSFAGLVTSRQQGRYVIYTANFDTMNALLVFLSDNCCGSNSHLLLVCPPADGADQQNCCGPDGG